MLRRAVARRVIVKISPGILPFSLACLQSSSLALLFTIRATGGAFAAGLGRGGLCRSALHAASLRWNGFLVCLLGFGSLARRFGKVGEAFPAQLLEHLPKDRSRKIEVESEALGLGERLVNIPLVAEGAERSPDVLGGHEGVAACRHTQVLEERRIQAPDHTDHRLGLLDTSPDEQARVVAIGPASQDFALVHVVVLGDPVLELPEQPARQHAEVLVPEKPAVALDVHDAAHTRDVQRLLLVLERLAELTDEAADLILTAAALHQGGLVDYQRGLGAFPGDLVEPARRPLEPPFVVLEVPDLPGRLAPLFR